jgi:hypothetical protein
MNTNGHEFMKQCATQMRGNTLSSIRVHSCSFAVVIEPGIE